ncbi:hypothetical protein BD309DRAFT_146966 [Dichomitus squalens]|uniref:Uncharacterized protein n=1 Tax=Dichomitus squalens TaxID=114155 RepID=A0A4Q9PJ82_9APHY|nr:hypothetical protein BD309DRAFT_146966 [Dichomitus squalens]TBU54141.1 hypothetical protein BD310DRAFT_103171 [Dichomitus squalens]
MQRSISTAANPTGRIVSFNLYMTQTANVDRMASAFLKLDVVHPELRRVVRHRGHSSLKARPSSHRRHPLARVPENARRLSVPSYAREGLPSLPPSLALGGLPLNVQRAGRLPFLDFTRLFRNASCAFRTLPVLAMENCSGAGVTVLIPYQHSVVTIMNPSSRSSHLH